METKFDVHDGGSHAAYFNYDYECYAEIERMNKALAAVGCFAEQQTTWYTGIYPIKPVVLIERKTSKPVISSAVSSLPYEVKLSNCGNPDFRQDHTRPLPGTKCATMRVANLLHAREACRMYIQLYQLGCGNWNGGQVMQIIDAETAVEFAKVSYNGKVWDVAGKEIAV